jgi:ABC-type Fe3+/spermidine/putrescine transport system ATPase subunit
MRAGRIDQIGTPEDVYARPTTAFVADFIGAANLVPFERGANGSVVTPLGPIAVAEEPPAEATFLCWRPEDAELCDTSSENLIRGEVTERAFQGSYTELHVSAGSGSDQRLHVQEGAPAQGSQITFRLPPDKIRFVRGAP